MLVSFEEKICMDIFSSTNKTDSHDITEILLKVALNTITITNLFKSFTIVYLMLMSNVKGTDPFTQHNGQKKKDMRTNNELQNIHIKLKIQLHEPH
jgi:hypothetical protein